MKLLLFKTIRNLILSLFSVLLFIGTFLSMNQIASKQIFAQATCTYEEQCVSNHVCTCVPGTSLQDGSCTLYENKSSECGSALIGGVQPPRAVGLLNIRSGQEIGLIFFASRILNFANIVAGILVMINFVVAGFSYVTSAGNAGNMVKINEKLMWSLVGILIIVGSYTFAALFGLIFYGDPTFIITPELTRAV